MNPRNRKLTDAQVILARSDYCLRAATPTIAEYARQINVATSTLWQRLTNRRIRHRHKVTEAHIAQAERYLAVYRSTLSIKRRARSWGITEGALMDAIHGRTYKHLRLAQDSVGNDLFKPQPFQHSRANGLVSSHDFG